MMLIIDDDPQFSKRVKEWVNDYAMEAESMAQANELLKFGKFDVIILDLGLPDSDPHQTARFCSTLATRAQNAALVVVSQTEDPSKFRCVKEVADSWAMKKEVNDSFSFNRLVEQGKRRIKEQPCYERPSSVLKYMVDSYA